MRKNLIEKVQIHPYIRRDDHRYFQNVYPRLLNLFIERAVNIACNDAGFFEQVFFDPRYHKV